VRLASSRACVIALAAAVCCTPLMASAPDLAKVRIGHFRKLGAAYKTVSDALRHGDVHSDSVRQALQQIEDAANNLGSWFPPGSGPQPGVKTSAKPEIWTDANEFRAAREAFASQNAALQRVAPDGDAAAIRTEVLKLGATCKACHDKFRVPED